MTVAMTDGHTHVFNVGFIPIEGVLLARKVPRWIAKGVADVLDRLLQRDLIDASVNPDIAADRVAFTKMLEGEFRADRIGVRDAKPSASDLTARFARAVPAAELENVRDVLNSLAPHLDLLSASRAKTQLKLGPLIDGDPNGRTRLLLDQLFREAAVAVNGGVITGAETAFGFAVESVDIGSLIDWLMMLVLHEARIAASFASAWDPAAVFTAQIHHMMDMELHYPGKPPAYGVDEQLRRMRAISLDCNPPLIGFVAYAPFRDEAVARVKQALDMGFAGVKFYPPSGYRPIDNVEEDLDRDLMEEKHIRLTATELDARNCALFEMCVAADAPVFTHCTSSGMEARSGMTGHFSNPRHWRRVLERKGCANLRLCFGHAGGQEGWTAPPTAQGNSMWAESYAYEVLELCVSYNNVYCDFGYFDSLLDAGVAANFALRLAAAIERYPKFAEKCCYGTDWHLIAIKADAKTFPNKFSDIIESNEKLRPHLDSIVRKNALAFANIPGFVARCSGVLGKNEREKLASLVGAMGPTAKPGMSRVT